MKLDDVTISRAIVESYMKELFDYLDSDAAIVGGGPAGLVASYYLSKAGFKTVLFESKLSLGGGMWGGGMMFNKIVVQREPLAVMDEMGIRYERYRDDYYIAESVEAVACLIDKSVKAGTKIFNCIRAEDVYVEENRVTGLVLNWTAVGLVNLHVDPITMRAGYVIDATGHPSEICAVLERKAGVKLNTPTGKIEGEKPMWADRAESKILENTREVYGGLYVTGMASNAVYGDYRMGPIFGGMLLSGKKAAEDIIEKLK